MFRHALCLLTAIAFGSSVAADKYVVTEGRHVWTIWRHNLNDFAPLLFTQAAP